MRDGTSTPNRQEDPNPPNRPRARWMGVLAKAKPSDLKEAWTKLATKPDFRLLRGPETGLALARGRVGGIGEKFNVGEISLTRCSLAVADGKGGEVAGHGFVCGCDEDHAKYAALFDALMQLPDFSPSLERDLIAPLEKGQSQNRRDRIETAQASRVEFFTMVRGD